MITKLCVLLGLVVFLWMATTRSLAQGSGGRINGVVQDDSGAVIPGVTVVAKNMGTGQDRSAVTNSSGGYIIADLAPGRYDVTIEATAGFERYVQHGVIIYVDRDTGVFPVLRVGANTQTVEVTAGGDSVETAKSSVTTTVENQQITEMPLNGRDILNLVSIQNGVINTNFFGASQTQEPLVVVNGGRGAENTYYLDGVSNTNSIFNTASPYPNPDAIQEFTSTTSSADAQYGRGDGATVTVVTKSGTNSLHGSAWEFLRNQVMDATPFGATQASPYKRNQFGFAIGGPVVKNRTFFFGSYQGTRVRANPGIDLSRVPTATEITGDLSQYFPPNSIIDPTTGQPFPGNIIPAAQLDPVIQKLIGAEIPLPNAVIAGVPELVTTPKTPVADNQFVVKVDHRLNDANQLTARYFQDTNPSSIIYGPESIPDRSTWELTFKNYEAAVIWARIFSPKKLNQFTISWYKWEDAKLPQVSELSWQSLGANIALPPVHPWQAPVGVAGFFNAVADETTTINTNSYYLTDALTLSVGRHNIRLGGNATLNQQFVNSLPSGNGIGNFSGQFTSNAMADFLLGDVGTFQQYAAVLQRRWQPDFALFVQDDWQVRSNLTLNLGLRWEPMVFPRDYGGEAAKFVPGQQSTVFPGAPRGVIFVGDNGMKNAALSGTQWRILEPRIGVGWDPFKDHKSSVRMGFGVYHEQPEEQGFDFIIPPFSIPILLQAPPGRIDNPYPPGFGNPFTLLNETYRTPAAQRDAFPFSNYLPFSAPNFIGFEPGMPAPTSLQWNLSLERQVIDRSVIGIAYVGTHGYREWNYIDANPPTYEAGNDPVTGLPLSTAANANSRRLRYSGFGQLEEEGPFGNNVYHSMQVKFVHPFTHGLQVGAYYTIQKNIGIERNAGVANQAGAVNPFNPSADRGLTEWDIPQQFDASVIWRLPWFKEQQGAIGRILGGWEVAAIPSLHGGFPFTIGAYSNNSLSNEGIDRADYVPGQNPRTAPLGPEGQKPGTFGGYAFNPEAFQPNAVGTFGDTPPGVLRGPGTSNLDLGFYKNFRIVEDQQLQFRSELFNAFNHPNLSTPDTNLQDPLHFGQILGKTGVRVVELGLKYSF